jgi:hypothetical protein
LLLAKSLGAGHYGREDMSICWICLIVRSIPVNVLAPLASLARRLGNKGIAGLTLMGILLCHLATGGPAYTVPIFSGTNTITAMTYGDFDPNHSGSELACMMSDGSIVELALGPSGWTASTIFVYPEFSLPWFPQLRTSLKVGKVLSEIPGQQLVIYYDPSNGWTNQLIADYSGGTYTSWDMDVGDLDPTHSGDEVFSIQEAGYDFSEGLVFEEQGGIWTSNNVYYGEVGMGVAIGHSNPYFPQNEAVVVTEMGPTYEIVPPATGGPGPWPTRTLWDDADHVGWVVKIGDVDPQTPGTNQIVYGTRVTDQIMMSQYNGTNQQEVSILFTGINTNTEVNNMYDVAIGQIFPPSTISPGKQILGVDYSGSVYSVEKSAGQWQGSTLWQDTGPLYAVLTGSLLPTPGDEAVVGGASGAVTLLCNPSPVLNLSLNAQGQAVLSWTGITGITYAVDTITNLSSTSWNNVTNMAYQAGFCGTLSYTNVEAGASSSQFFRVSASW